MFQKVVPAILHIVGNLYRYPILYIVGNLCRYRILCAISCKQLLIYFDSIEFEESNIRIWPLRGIYWANDRIINLKYQSGTQSTTPINKPINTNEPISFNTLLKINHRQHLYQERDKDRKDEMKQE